MIQWEPNILNVPYIERAMYISVIGFKCVQKFPATHPPRQKKKKKEKEKIFVQNNPQKISVIVYKRN